MAVWLAIPQSRAQSSAFITLANGDLYSVNSTDCSVHFIGSTGEEFNDIALTPNGTLYGIRGAFGKIMRIDTSDASATHVCYARCIEPECTYYWLSSTSLVALNDSILLLEHEGSVHGVCVTDSSAWWMGDLLDAAHGDIAWFDDDLYLALHDYLIRFQITADNTEIENEQSLIQIDPVPGCYGLSSGHLSPDHNSLLGFSDLIPPNLVCFSPVDGSYVNLCALDLPDVVWGAASFRSPPAANVGCASPLSTFSGRAEPFQMTVTDQLLHIQLIGVTSLQRWELVDMSGRTINSGVLTSDTTIPIGHLDAGIFLVRLYSGSIVQAYRFGRIR